MPYIQELNYPWSKRHEESPEAYEAFDIYVKMSPIERKYQAVADYLEKNVSLIRRWGAKHDWIKRSTLYDRYQAAEFDKDIEETVNGLRLQVMAEESRDYDKLRSIWQDLAEQMHGHVVNGEASVKDLKTLIEARLSIDSLGRRASRMPDRYLDRDTGTPEKEDEPDWIISLPALSSKDE